LGGCAIAAAAPASRPVFRCTYEEDQTTNGIIDARNGLSYSIFARILLELGGKRAMRARVFAGCAIIAVGVSIAAYAAPAEPASESKAAGAPTGDAPITFEQYRAWRLAAMERRRSEIDMQLASADLSPARKTRLEETRAYYKWLADMPEAERDKRFRERFDRIDANHDGVVDTAERAAWRERQRAFYGGVGKGGSRQPVSAPPPDGKKDAAAPPTTAPPATAR
jgi:hypothetical protein